MSRAELYSKTHTNKEGNPVDAYCADKIVSSSNLISYMLTVDLFSNNAQFEYTFATHTVCFHE